MLAARSALLTDVHVSALEALCSPTLLPWLALQASDAQKLAAQAEEKYQAAEAERVVAVACTADVQAQVWAGTHTRTIRKNEHQRVSQKMQSKNHNLYFSAVRVLAGETDEDRVHALERSHADGRTQGNARCRNFRHRTCKSTYHNVCTAWCIGFCTAQPLLTPAGERRLKTGRVWRRQRMQD